MNDDEAFVQTIVRTPDDETPIGWKNATIPDAPICGPRRKSSAILASEANILRVSTD
jgi:hypothetical protein